MESAGCRWSQIGRAHARAKAARPRRTVADLRGAWTPPRGNNCGLSWAVGAMEQKKKDSNGNGQVGNSQALAPVAKRVQAVVVDKKDDKKQDMRQILSDRIGDFIRLAGVLQRLEGGLPKQAEAYEKVSKSVNDLSWEIKFAKQEMHQSNQDLSVDVKTDTSEMKKSIVKMDSSVVVLT